MYDNSRICSVDPLFHSVDPQITKKYSWTPSEPPWTPGGPCGPRLKTPAIDVLKKIMTIPINIEISWVCQPSRLDYHVCE